MKIAILDDEIYYCNKIEKLIHENKLLETCTIDKYTKPIDFINRTKHYDILFLDIDMPEIDGIALSKQLRFDNIIIIFFILLASPIKKIKIIIKFLNEKI